MKNRIQVVAIQNCIPGSGLDVLEQMQAAQWLITSLPGLYLAGNEIRSQLGLYLSIKGLPRGAAKAQFFYRTDLQ